MAMRFPTVLIAISLLVGASAEAANTKTSSFVPHPHAHTRASAHKRPTTHTSHTQKKTASSSSGQYVDPGTGAHYSPPLAPNH
jgi:hypothetical protein